MSGPAGHEVTRRGALSGMCLLAASAAVAGCGAPGDPAASAPGTEIASTDDVPVGGGTVFGEHRVVVTQPVEGSFEAFSAVCTHQGCTVDEVVDGAIACPCHGSRFGISDGAVVRGPAEQPLPPVAITVEGGSIALA